MDKKYVDNYKQLGLNISFYRKNKGLTQMELAALLNVDITHIGKIELCKVGASLDVIFGIARILEIPVYKLFEFRI